MDAKQSGNMEHTESRGWLATHKALAVGLWIGALGIFLQAVTGASGYEEKVPPGIPILAVTGLIVYFTSRWLWTALLGLFLTGLIWVGVFETPGTAYRLHHPQDVGPLIGTLVQLSGLLLALMAGVGNRSREVPAFESQPKYSTRLTAKPSRCSAVGLWV